MVAWWRLVVYFCRLVVKIEKVIRFLKLGCQLHGAPHILEFFKNSFLNRLVVVWWRLVVYFCRLVVKIEKCIRFSKSWVAPHILELITNSFFNRLVAFGSLLLSFGGQN